MESGTTNNYYDRGAAPAPWRRFEVTHPPTGTYRAIAGLPRACATGGGTGGPCMARHALNLQVMYLRRAELSCVPREPPPPARE